MKILFVFCLLFAPGLFSQEWRDPHDMDTKVKHKYVNAKLLKSQSLDIIPIPSCAEDYSDTCFFYMKRLINMLWQAAYIDKTDPDEYTGQIRFRINKSDLQSLLTFAKEEEFSLDKLRSVDRILDDAFHKTTTDDILESLQTVHRFLVNLILNPMNLWLIGGIILSYVVFQLIKHDFSLVYVMKYLLIILLIIDFGYRYNHMLNEAETYNAEVVYSPECDTGNMNLGQWFGYITGSKKCEKKVITPLPVFLFQVKSIIAEPMTGFGIGMGGFGGGIWDGLSDAPFAKFFIYPILIVFSFFLLVILLFFITGQSIELSGPLLKLKFGSGHRAEDRVRGFIEHRKLIEEVKLSSDSNKSSPGSSKAETVHSTSKYQKSSKEECDSDAISDSTKKVPDIVDKDQPVIETILNDTKETLHEENAI